MVSPKYYDDCKKGKRRVNELVKIKSYSEWKWILNKRCIITYNKENVGWKNLAHGSSNGYINKKSSKWASPMEMLFTL